MKHDENRSYEILCLLVNEGFVDTLFF